LSKRSPLPQQRRHVGIFDEDWDFLMQEFGPDSSARIGAGTAIRTIVHHHVIAMKARANAEFDKIRQDMKASMKELVIESQVDQTAGSDE